MISIDHCLPPPCADEHRLSYRNEDTAGHWATDVIRQGEAWPAGRRFAPWDDRILVIGTAEYAAQTRRVEVDPPELPKVSPWSELSNTVMAPPTPVPEAPMVEGVLAGAMLLQWIARRRISSRSRG